jgi:hypothetical protein
MCGGIDVNVAMGNSGLFGRINERTSVWSTKAIAAAAYALAIGGLSIAVNAADALDGSAPALGRAALGMVGLAAGVVLWLRKDLEVVGWRLALIWALIQIPIVAWDQDGSVTTQIVRFPLMASSETTVNGVVTAASEFGVNLLAIALAGIYGKLQTEAVTRR